MGYPEIHWKPPETSGNLRKPPETSGNPDLFINKIIDKKVYIKKSPEACQILTGNRRSPFLEVSGGFWRFPEVSRGFRRFVEVFGGFWRFPEVSGGFWIPSTLEFQAEHSKFDRYSSKINFLTLHILLSIKEIGRWKFLEKNIDLNAIAEILITQKTQKGKVIFSGQRSCGVFSLGVQN